MADGSIEIDINGNSKGFDDTVAELPNTVKASTVAFGNILADLGKKAISSLSSVAESAMATGQAFENSMSNVSALQMAAGATSDDIALLKKSAEEFGASTQFSMAECADALGYMALAGWDAQQSVDALPGVLSLAAASGMELAAASDMVTDYMSAFSKSVSDYTGEALTAAEFSDKLAYAQANSNTNVAQLGEAFKNCAANMNAAGQQMDTVTALLGTMANQGLKGAESGTVLTAVMRDINNKMQDGAISINGTNIAVSDANGNYRDMIDIMADVEQAVGGMGETERSAALGSVFTADSIKGMNLVLNAGTDSVRQLEAGLSDCEGAAEDMAKTLNDNLEGDLKYLSSALDTVKNSIYEGVNAPLRELVQSVTSDVAPQLNELVNALFGVASGAEDAGERLQASVSALISWVTEKFATLFPVIVDATGKMLGQLVLAVVQNTPALLQAVSDIFFNLVNGLSNLAPTLLTALANMISQVILQIISAIPKFAKAGTQLFQGLTDAVLSLNIADTFSELLALLADKITSAIPTFTHVFEKIFNSILKALPDMIASFSSVLETMPNAFDNLNSTMMIAGKRMIKLLIEGILSAIPEILKSVGLIAVRIVSTLTDSIRQNTSSLLEFASQIMTALFDSIASQLPNLSKIGSLIMDLILSSLNFNVSLLVNTGAFLIESLIDSISENIGSVAEIAVDIIQILSESIMKNVGSLLSIGADFITPLIRIISQNIGSITGIAVNIIETLANAIVQNLPMLLESAVQIVFALADALMQNIAIIADVAVALISSLVQMINENAVLLAGTAAELITALITAITENLPMLLTSALEIVLALLFGIVENLPILMQAAVRIINILVASLIENAVLLINAAVSLVLTLAEMILQNLPELIEVAIQIVFMLAEMLIQNAALLVDAAVNLVLTLVDMILDNLDILLNASLKIILAVADGLIANLPKLLESAIKIVLSVISGILEALPKLQSTAIQIIETLVEFVSQNYDKIIRAGIDLLLSLIGGIVRTIPDLIATVPKIINAIWDTITAEDWGQLGINILQGLANGLIAGLSVVWDTIQTVGTSIMDGFKDFFGIHSPSRLFRDEIGKFLLPGISVGVDGSISDTTRNINQALDDLMSRINIDDLQMRLDSAVQMQGYSAISPPETQKIFKNTFREPEIKATENTANSNPESQKTVINAVFMLDGEILAEGMAELVDREQGVTIALSKRGINR